MAVGAGAAAVSAVVGIVALIRAIFGSRDDQKKHEATALREVLQRKQDQGRQEQKDELTAMQEVLQLVDLLEAAVRKLGADRDVRLPDVQQANTRVVQELCLQAIAAARGLPVGDVDDAVRKAVDASRAAVDVLDPTDIPVDTAETEPADLQAAAAVAEAKASAEARLDALRRKR